MNIKAAIRRLESRSVSASDLSCYFGTKSVDDLIQELRQLTWNDYFELEVFLSSEYFDWQKTHRDLIFGNDIIHPTDYAYKSMRERDTYNLSINTTRPLDRGELAEVMQKLPADILKLYIRFKLLNIDLDKLCMLIEERKADGGTNEDEFYDLVEYNGLSANGTEIAYHGTPIPMSLRHRLVVRLLLEKQGSLCFRDEFKDRRASILKRPAGEYKNVNETLRKLIADVHSELRAVIGKDCIENEPGEGWRLKLEP